MDSEKPLKQEALGELLKKLRVAQEDILQSARSDSFAVYVCRVERHPESAARRQEYGEAFEFLKRAASMESADLLRGLEFFLPLFAEMKRFFPAEDEECALLDYVCFVGARLGEIPEDRFFLNGPGAGGAAASEERARASLELTGTLLRQCREISDEDLRSLAIRALLGGVSYLEAERDGLDAGEDPWAEESSGENEIYALAARYGVGPATVDRAMRLMEHMAELTAARRRKRREAGKKGRS